ncbi:pimeloyl-ACP methyl ester carboxylesterase [Aurantimicrobium minutum]|uniref:alpha/beta hydrolase n=1 Tax=Aurantimicrobium minutum TaxID=708131 RepID=UPI002474DE18|nr:alpha/beta hydrolase [Aurantimicrobium minutum]MDH6531873.1 pimeloyl-ACP methyl ester carboxylesterase [Aurantimicrobium minutum]
MNRFSLLSLGAGVVALVLSGCAAPVVPLPSQSPAAVAADLLPFYEQELDWSECEDQMQCAEATAPLDWAHPTGETISLAVVKHEASSKDRLGSLFVNPGGPGASGVNFVANSLDYAVSADVKKNYDVIGFDPRGVGASTSVTCYTDPTQMDQFLFEYTPTPRESDAWFAEGEQASANYTAACVENSGDLLAHVDTLSAAHDLDMLRAVVGDSRLNYLGYSYGTLLGAIYAENFPLNVGRMVLDGALNPASTSSEVMLTQAVGFEKALTAYLTECVTTDSCPFEGSVDESVQRISELLAQLDISPLEATDGRLLGADSMVTAIISPLYDRQSWDYLSDVFSAVLQGDADPAYTSVDWYYQRSATGSYSDNSTEAFIAINCLDYPVSADKALWAADAATLKEQAPVIGPYLAWGDQLCSLWPAEAVLAPAQVHARGSADILVVGTTGDPATPYRWAQELAAQLDKGHLVTYTGEGHTAYNKSNSCVNDAVDGFLLRGTVPARDPQC